MSSVGVGLHKKKGIKCGWLYAAQKHWHRMAQGYNTGDNLQETNMSRDEVERQETFWSSSNYSRACRVYRVSWLSGDGGLRRLIMYDTSTNNTPCRGANAFCSFAYCHDISIDTMRSTLDGTVYGVEKHSFLCIWSRLFIIQKVLRTMKRSSATHTLK